MDQLRKLYSSLSVGQRFGIVAAVLLLVAGISSFVHWRHESDFRPLFLNMPAEDAAAIVQKLKESGVEHRLSDNGTSVLVPTAKVDELRLEMAGAGLPRSGRIGLSCSIKRISASRISVNTSTTGERSKENWSVRSARSAKWSKPVFMSPFRKNRSFWTLESQPRPACWSACMREHASATPTCSPSPIWSQALSKASVRNMFRWSILKAICSAGLRKPHRICRTGPSVSFL